MAASAHSQQLEGVEVKRSEKLKGSRSSSPSSPFFRSTKSPGQGKSDPIKCIGKKLKILVVDDQSVNRNILCRMLRNFECEEAVNGSEAVDKIRGAKAQPYDLILMDLQMPVMDGIAATKEIRKIDENVAVILCSANVSSQEQYEKLITDGKTENKVKMNGFINKPVVRSALEVVVNRYSVMSVSPSVVPVMSATIETSVNVSIDDQTDEVADRLAEVVDISPNITGGSSFAFSPFQPANTKKLDSPKSDPGSPTPILTSFGLAAEGEDGTRFPFDQSQEQYTRGGLVF